VKGVLAFAAFGLGATLASAVMRGLNEGSQPDPRTALKEGVRLWKTVTDAAEAAQTEFDAFQAEMRKELEVETARPSTQTRRRIALEPPA